MRLTRLSAGFAAATVLLAGGRLIPASGQAVDLTPQQQQELKQVESQSQNSQTAPQGSNAQAPAQGAGQNIPLKASDTNAPIQGRVVRSLVDLSQIQQTTNTLSSHIEDLVKFCEDKMVDVSYPVLLPAVSTYPVTLATPDFAVYSGHFAEKRTKYVVSSIQNIGNLVDVLSGDIQALDIPKEKEKLLSPLIDDAEDTMKAVNHDYSAIASQMGSGNAFDAEMTSAKLTDMRKYITTIDHDLQAIFRIVNLKNATTADVDVLMQLRLLGRDAHWLGVIAHYLHDSAMELDPLDAFVSDAQNQGWLVVGSNLKDLARIQHNPYTDIKAKNVNKRMSELSEYVKAVQDNIQAMKIPAEKVPQVQPVIDEFNSLMGDVNSQYKILQTATTSGNIGQQRKTIADAATAISKDMEQADNIEHRIAQKMLEGNTIL